MEIKIKRLHDDAVIPYKTYNDDFCYDVVATSCEEVAPNVYRYGLGFALQIDREAENPFTSVFFVTKTGALMRRDAAWQLSIDFRPRSSVWKTGMVLSNCEGTIDELFRGEVTAVFYHVMPDMPRYKTGDRIGQIKLGFTLPMTFREADELTETERGAGGYGSTGT